MSSFEPLKYTLYAVLKTERCNNKAGAFRADFFNLYKFLIFLNQLQYKTIFDIITNRNINVNSFIVGYIVVGKTNKPIIKEYKSYEDCYKKQWEWPFYFT